MPRIAHVGVRLARACAVVAAVLAIGQSTAQAKYIVNILGNDKNNQPYSVNGIDSQPRWVLNSSSGASFIVAATNQQPTGTGYIDPFLRIQETGQERGYNTSLGKPLDDLVGSQNFTHAIQLKDLAVITDPLTGGQYYKFLLDVNQDNAIKPGPISLNQVQIFVSGSDVGVRNTLDQEATTALNASISFNGATKVFQMSNDSATAADSYEVEIQSGSGSGSGDMYYYVSTSVFAGYSANSYVTLFSQFGKPNGVYDSNGGFEEWTAIENQGSSLNPVPGPSGFVLAFSGFTGFGGLVGMRRFLAARRAVAAA